jgi:hypothetical protein
MRLCLSRRNDAGDVLLFLNRYDIKHSTSIRVPQIFKPFPTLMFTTIGSVADTASGALVDISSDSPNINFNPGSRFILASTAESGGSLASLAPNQPAQPAPATTVSTAPAAGQSTAQAQTTSAQASTSAAASQQPQLNNPRLEGEGFELCRLQVDLHPGREDHFL